ncbi:MAG: hypothetical protein AMXMBFR64_28850 [Myxococcales bacterium]
MRLRSIALLALAALALAGTSTALAWPNGPNEDPRLDPPNDPGFGGQWNLWSYIPEEWVTANGISAYEVKLGTGIHADRAWQRTTGDRRVIIAVLDSGIHWENDDLRNKHYLNKGELAKYMPAKGPDSKDEWDVNNDGWFDIRDYEHVDPDFGKDKDLNGNGVFDPGDLIRLASDGKDDDGNGYVDDISGWDFFWNDNDPYDDTRFGHGTGEARDSAAEGNNGKGDIGVCPNCTILNVRVGDGFVTDVNDFAEGVIFGVDSGASVIQEALGTVNNSKLAMQAIDWAYDNNVVVIASAADELSFHHNMPGTNNHTVYVHAVVHDHGKKEKSTTFLNFNNCTNYGGQLVLSTPGGGCSSEATGITSGHAGLIYAAGLKAALDPPLSAAELHGILIMSSDDIDVAGSATDPTKFPSGPGWDLHFGYGRNNARTSVDFVLDARIPPELDIVDPLWFQMLYPDRKGQIDVTGRIGTRRDGKGPRYASYDWELEYAIGVDPKGGWTKIAGGTTPGMEGVIATWDATEAAKKMDLDKQLKDPHGRSVTLRLRASVTGKPDLKGEFRKTVHVHKDPDLHPAFPIWMNGSAEGASKMVDLDGDGTDEIIQGTGTGEIHAFKADGSQADGWPVRMGYRPHLDPANDLTGKILGMGNHRDSCAHRADKTGCKATADLVVDPDVGQTTIGAPAIGKLMGEDGDLFVVVTTWDGGVFVYDSKGKPAPGFPVSTDLSNSVGTTDPDHIVDHGIMGSPVLADLDKDGKLEIIVAAQDGFMYVWHADGKLMKGWPVRVRDPKKTQNSDRIVCTPAVGDVDGDGWLDIVTGTNETFGAKGAENEGRGYVLYHDGNDHAGGPFHPGWPIKLFGLQDNVLPVVGKGVPANPILADLDYDGTMEIAIEAISSSGYIYNHDGTVYRQLNNQVYGPKSNSSDSPLYMLINHGTFARLDAKGGIDYIKGGAGFGFAKTFVAGGVRENFEHHLGAWDTANGKFLDAWPRVMEDWQFFMNPTVADIDGDKKPEVLNGSGGYLVRAINSEGVEPSGWPKMTGGWLTASPTMGDLDGDGKFDVAVGIRNGWMFAWKAPGPSDGIVEWQSFAHDHHNTNNYDQDFLYGTAVKEPPKPGEDIGGPSEDAGTGGGDVAGGVDASSGGETIGGADAAGGSDVAGGPDAASAGGGGGGDDGGCAAAPGAPRSVLVLLLVLLLPAVRRRLTA